MWKAVKSILLLILTAMSCRVAAALQPVTDSDSTRTEVHRELERALELFDSDDPELAAEPLAHILQELAANPVNINTAGIDELLQVPGVSLKAGRAIIDYRERGNPFESVEGLVEVPGIGTVTLERMRPYVTAGTGAETGRASGKKFRYWTEESRFEVFSRYRQTLQEREGYRRPDSAGYLGSPVKYYQRFRYTSNHVSANLTQEKDAGEPLAGPAGFDYSSWHAALENTGRFKRIVAGDYSLSFGQGLVFWDGGGFGKGREVVGSLARNGRSVRAYSSASEANYFRGAAATYGDNIQISGFYSAMNRDATPVSEDTVRQPGKDGLHRTAGEMEKKGRLKQRVYGGNVRLKLPAGFVGVTGYRTLFGSTIEPGAAVHNRYKFRGKQSSVVGADIRVMLGPAVLFGEGARSENGGYGLAAGVESPLNNRTDLAVVYRNYRKDFHSLYGNGFGEQSGEPQNEEGLYLGLRHRLNPQITLSAYFDQYRFPAPRFGTSRPTQGNDWLGLAEFKLNRDLKFYLQGKGESKEDDYLIPDSLGRNRLQLGNSLRSTFRAHFECRVNRQVRIRTRGEIVRSRPAGEPVEYGYLLYQDLRLEPTPKWTVDTRVTLFETQSFNSRVYQFENDLLYQFSIPSLFHQGQRLYLLVHFEPADVLDIWAKFGIAVYENRQSIGSGLEEIEGNKRSEVGVQVRFRI